MMVRQDHNGNLNRRIIRMESKKEFQILRMKDSVGLRSTIYALVAQGKFPAPLNLFLAGERQVGQRTP